MEYLVTMTTQVPDGTSEEAVSDVRAREAVRSSELAAEGALLRLWRPPLQPGEWRTLGLFAANARSAMAAIAPKATPSGRTSRRFGFPLIAWSCLAWPCVLVSRICRYLLLSGRSVH